MARDNFGPRKQRTRQHIIADLSVHHLEGFILEEGHTAQRLHPDYGYDLFMFTYDSQGYVEPGLVWFQLKASESFQTSDSAYVFDLDIRDYNLWMLEEMPVILVLFDASRRRACWLPVQRYFLEDVTRQPKSGARSVRLSVPQRQVLNRRAIRNFQNLKSVALTHPERDES